MNKEPQLYGQYVQLENQRYDIQCIAVFLGIIALYCASFIQIPIGPVPITLQTFIVTFIGAFFGPRLGALTVVLWLLCAALGLPLLADGKHGLAPFYGVTAGYLYAFPLAAFLTGQLARQGWNGDNFKLCTINMVLGNLLCLSLGALWLASQKGGNIAFFKGFMPFLLGALVKSFAAAFCLKIISHLRVKRAGF
ncbi:biotin transporter BioY (plasmid) [Bartonella sp. HY329]|uniref:biotin transporter BioY n=1 Tax=unclassified Bartonella TaxID=2645622 RepID=UPI0021C62F93|nr:MULTISPECIES: biotin transporter BioY [unclassified Bartonella]UXM96505.1 biotin transporter BioY [Bartonella sp. HY329]UXN10828.1 biotin transporter BioY [Bartonella sp. HY328]